MSKLTVPEFIANGKVYPYVNPYNPRVPEPKPVKCKGAHQYRETKEGWVCKCGKILNTK